MLPYLYSPNELNILTTCVLLEMVILKLYRTVCSFSLSVPYNFSFLLDYDRIDFASSCNLNVPLYGKRRITANEKQNHRRSVYRFCKKVNAIAAADCIIYFCMADKFRYEQQGIAFFEIILKHNTRTSHKQ